MGIKPFCARIPTHQAGPIEVKPTPKNFLVFDDTIFNSSATSSDFVEDDKSNNKTNASSSDDLSSWINKYTRNMKKGGEWEPPTCRARHRLIIIVPYRDRLENLNGFFYHMHPFLQRQQIAYRVFVVEQNGTGTFNKGVLMNTGFVQALKLYNKSIDLEHLDKYKNDRATKYPFDCVTFHDVDLLPEGRYRKTYFLFFSYFSPLYVTTTTR